MIIVFKNGIMKKIKHESHQCQFSVMLLSRFQEELKVIWKNAQITNSLRNETEHLYPSSEANVVFVKA